MQVTKSLLVGMAALPWASAFGTMPHKTIKDVDPLAGLDDVDTQGESATATDQQYIAVKGTSSASTTGAAVCAAVLNKAATAGCYRHITSANNCEQAAEKFRDEYNPSWPDTKGLFVTPTPDPASAYPADCIAIKSPTYPFYFTEGGASPGYGSQQWSKVRFICEYICPPEDQSNTGTTCYAGGARAKSNPTCGEAGEKGVCCPKVTSDGACCGIITGDSCTPVDVDGEPLASDDYTCYPVNEECTTDALDSAGCAAGAEACKEYGCVWA